MCIFAAHRFAELKRITFMHSNNKTLICKSTLMVYYFNLEQFLCKITFTLCIILFEVFIFTLTHYVT